MRKLRIVKKRCKRRFRNRLYREKSNGLPWIKVVVTACAIVLVITVMLLAFYLDSDISKQEETVVPTEVTQEVTEIPPTTVPETLSPVDKLINMSPYEAYSILNEENEKIYESDFELPVVGATAYVSVNTLVYSNSDLSGEVVGDLSASDAFYITEDKGAVWKICSYSGIEGYISNSTCFINLPDIIPSIVYNITNSSSSIFLSSKKEIPNVTGEKLMDFYKYNERYDKDMYMAFIQYPMAYKIQQAQNSALKDGNTLVIYESYRTYEAQMRVADSLIELAATNDEVNAGLSGSPWALNWFIATGLSTHQMGCAIDVTIAHIDGFDVQNCGEHRFLNVIDCEEYQMQCAMHELSTQAVSLAYPVNGRDNQWVDVPDNSLMTEASKMLKKYCTEAGMAPLASEWWHFDDWDAVDNLGDNYQYEYYFSDCVSKPLA